MTSGLIVTTDATASAKRFGEPVEFRGVCDCGWRGEWTEDERQAHTEAQRHWAGQHARPV